MPVVSVSKTISRAGVRVASINMSDVHFPPDPALESGTPIIGLESRVFLAGKRPHKRLYFSKGARLAAACRDDHVGASPLFGIRHLFCEDGGELLRRHVRDRKSVVSGKSVSVRVDLGGRRIIKKKNHDHKSRDVRES